MLDKQAEIPIVNIIIPTFNRKEKLDRLINSILKSSYPVNKLDIIVVDDASTDGTYEYIKNKYSTIKLIKNKKELLISGAGTGGCQKQKGI